MKKILKYSDKPLLIVSILLFVIGLIMVFSASNVTAYMSQKVSPYNYFVKQGIFLLIGLCLSIVMLKFHSKSYLVLSRILLFIGIIGLALLPFFGTERNDAISWYDLGPFSIQPSEFVKIIIIVWLACYYEKNKDKLTKYIKSLYPLGICILIAFLIFTQPDLGTAIIFSTIVASIFLISPIKNTIKFKTFFALVGLAIVAVMLIVGTGHEFLFERQKERLDYKNPCDKLLTGGSQVCNGYIAINNGGLTGVGLGNSTQKYLYLPEPYTDFIFCIIVEELGLISGIGIILLYLFLLYRILLIGKNSYTDRGAMICFGVAVYIFIHISVNLLGLFGLMPMTGVPLPFMSYGGSFTICLIAALTLVQRISVENGMMRSKKEGN